MKDKQSFMVWRNRVKIRTQKHNVSPDFKELENISVINYTTVPLFQRGTTGFV